MTTEQLETLRAAAEQMQGRAGELLRMALDHAGSLQDKLTAAYAANQLSFDAGEKRARDWYESKLEHVRAESYSLRRQLEQAGQRTAPGGWRRGILVKTNQEDLPPPGRLFMQFWSWHEVVCRVYGNDREELRARCDLLAAAIRPAAPAADAQPADTVQVPRDVLNGLVQSCLQYDDDAGAYYCTDCGVYGASNNLQHLETCDAATAKRLLAGSE